MFRPPSLHCARGTEASHTCAPHHERRRTVVSAGGQLHRMTTALVEEMAMPVLDAKALDADPEGVALLRSVLDTGRKPCAVQNKKLPKQRESEERADTLDGRTASTAGSQPALAQLIPTSADQNPLAQSRRPMDMIVQ